MYLVAPIKSNQFTQYIHKAKNINQIGKKKKTKAKLNDTIVETFKFLFTQKHQ